MCIYLFGTLVSEFKPVKGVLDCVTSCDSNQTKSITLFLQHFPSTFLWVKMIPSIHTCIHITMLHCTLKFYHGLSSRKPYCKSLPNLSLAVAEPLANRL